MCTKGYVYVDVSQNAICQRKKKSSTEKLFNKRILLFNGILYSQLKTW